MWFASWAFRKRYELDHPLDMGMQVFRWSVVCVAFGLALIPGPGAKWIRLCGGFTGLAFLCWPNFAYHITRLIRHDSNDPSK